MASWRLDDEVYPVSADADIAILDDWPAWRDA
jgi:hypothetical protein